MLRKKIKQIHIALIISMLLVTPFLGIYIPLTNFSTTSGTPNISPVDMTYYDRFMDLFSDIQTKGYLSPDGVPYHSVETLLVEAPDYGHMTTSEAFSFLTWLGATYGRLTGDWSYYKDAWTTTEQYIIPDISTDQPGVGTYPPDSPAQYAPEGDVPSDYPVLGDANAPTGIDPIGSELSSTYGAGIYQMHWLLDVDNWYGYGNNGDGVSKNSYINTYQRGPQESVWETVPQPSWEDFSWGTPNGGFLPLFGEFGTPSQQWRYTSASDADARQVQASYWALKWAQEQGVENEITTETEKAAKMGDFLRYTMFDKYFRPIGVQDGTAAGTGYDSAHYLLSWYASWGGDVGGAWSWRIGSSHSHQGYQNVMAAYALTNEASMRPSSPNGYNDWQTSLERQLEFYEYLQSAEGGIAGGVTNSWNGRYDQYPTGISTFYDMAYDWQPVYHDPPSNSWFGFQTWSMERVIEYYLETGNARAKAISEKWVDWAIDNVILNADGTFQVPSTMEWSGQPDTWTGTSTGNPNLHVTVDHGDPTGVDIGVAACLAKALIKYAAATQKWDGVAYESARNTSKEIIDRMWTLYRDDLGIAAPETRGDYSRFNDEVYIPTDYTGVNAQGATLQNGMTFIEMRPKYLEDPDWQRVSDAINAGEDPEMLYHRFWAQADVAMANAMYHILFVEEEPIDRPQAPTGLIANVIDPNRIDLSWDANTEPDVTNYRVYRTTNPGVTPSSSNMIATISSTSYSDINTLPSTDYYYIITAVNDLDVESIPSIEISVSTPTSNGWITNARGINLGNALEAPNEGEWGVTIQESYFQLIKDEGFDVIRIPIKFSGHASTTAPYTIDSAFMNRVDEVVNWALAHDFITIIDMHHYEEIMSDPAGNRDRFIGLWEQIATHFQNAPDNLYFELLNEPNDALTSDLWNQYLIDGINIVRETNPNRLLLIGPTFWNNIQDLQYLSIPANDPNIIATFHYYNPFEFTHQGAPWVDGSDAWLGTTWTGTASEQAAVRSDLDTAVAWAEANNRELFLGEFGANIRAPYDSRVAWTTFVAREAEARGISWAYWEFCADDFGAYRQETQSWDQGILEALIPSGGDIDPPSTPTGLTATAISSSQINLNWNDNTESDLANYRVYRSTSASGTYTYISQTTTSSYSSTGLSASTTYYYKVSAVDTSSNESPQTSYVSATTLPGGGEDTTLRAQYLCGNTASTTQDIRAQIQILNDGPVDVSLTDITIRYWFTSEPALNDLTYSCDYAAIGSSGITTSFGDLGDIQYLETTFTSSATVPTWLGGDGSSNSLPVDANTGDIQNRIGRNSNVDFDQTNDYSFDASMSTYADAPQITVYYQDELVWGTEPPIGPISDPPSTNSPADVSIQVGQTGNSITWTATDDNPTTYSITQDGIQVDSGSWTSSQPITISVDGLSAGTYTYICTVSDGDGQSDSDSVTVSVTDLSIDGGEVWFSTVITQQVGNVFTTEIYVDTGSQNLGAYGFEIIWDQNILIVQGENDGVAAGADGFLAAANVDNNAGTMMVSGFEATGAGPNSQLHLLTITWEAVGAGNSVLDLTIETLVDSDTNTIGNPNAIDGSVVVEQYQNGDVNHDDMVDIVDALLIAQYYVELNPQPFYPEQADVNGDGVIDIIDALLVAQAYVGLIELPP